MPKTKLKPKIAKQKGFIANFLKQGPLPPTPTTQRTARSAFGESVTPPKPVETKTQPTSRTVPTPSPEMPALVSWFGIKSKTSRAPLPKTSPYESWLGINKAASKTTEQKSAQNQNSQERGEDALESEPVADKSGRKTSDTSRKQADTSETEINPKADFTGDRPGRPDHFNAELNETLDRIVNQLNFTISDEIEDDELAEKFDQFSQLALMLGAVITAQRFDVKELVSTNLDDEKTAPLKDPKDFLQDDIFNPLWANSETLTPDMIKQALNKLQGYAIKIGYRPTRLDPTVPDYTIKDVTPSHMQLIRQLELPLVMNEHIATLNKASEDIIKITPDTLQAAVTAAMQKIDNQPSEEKLRQIIEKLLPNVRAIQNEISIIEQRKKDLVKDFLNNWVNDSPTAWNDAKTDFDNTLKTITDKAHELIKQAIKAPIPASQETAAELKESPIPPTARTVPIYTPPEKEDLNKVFVTHHQSPPSPQPTGTNKAATRIGAPNQDTNTAEESKTINASIQNYRLQNRTRKLIQFDNSKREDKKEETTPISEKISPDSEKYRANLNSIETDIHDHILDLDKGYDDIEKYIADTITKLEAKPVRQSAAEQNQLDKERKDELERVITTIEITKALGRNNRTKELREKLGEVKNNHTLTSDFYDAAREFEALVNYARNLLGKHSLFCETGKKIDTVQPRIQDDSKALDNRITALEDKNKNVASIVQQVNQAITAVGAINPDLNNADAITTALSTLNGYSGLPATFLATARKAELSETQTDQLHYLITTLGTAIETKREIFTNASANLLEATKAKIIRLSRDAVTLKSSLPVISEEKFWGALEQARTEHRRISIELRAITITDPKYTFNYTQLSELRGLLATANANVIAADKAIKAREKSYIIELKAGISNLQSQLKSNQSELTREIKTHGFVKNEAVLIAIESNLAIFSKESGRLVKAYASMPARIQSATLKANIAAIVSTLTQLEHDTREARKNFYLYNLPEAPATVTDPVPAPAPAPAPIPTPVPTPVPTLVPAPSPAPPSPPPPPAKPIPTTAGAPIDILRLLKQNMGISSLFLSTKELNQVTDLTKEVKRLYEGFNPKANESEESFFKRQMAAVDRLYSLRNPSFETIKATLQRFETEFLQAYNHKQDPDTVDPSERDTVIAKNKLFDSYKTLYDGFVGPNAITNSALLLNITGVSENHPISVESDKWAKDKARDMDKSDWYKHVANLPHLSIQGSPFSPENVLKKDEKNLSIIHLTEYDNTKTHAENKRNREETRVVITTTLNDKDTWIQSSTQPLRFDPTYILTKAAKEALMQEGLRDPRDRRALAEQRGTDNFIATMVKELQTQQPVKEGTFFTNRDPLEKGWAPFKKYQGPFSKDSIEAYLKQLEKKGELKFSVAGDKWYKSSASQLASKLAEAYEQAMDPTALHLAAAKFVNKYLVTVKKLNVLDESRIAGTPIHLSGEFSREFAQAVANYCLLKNLVFTESKGYGVIGNEKVIRDLIKSEKKKGNTAFEGVIHPAKAIPGAELSTHTRPAAAPIPAPGTKMIVEKHAADLETLRSIHARAEEKLLAEHAAFNKLLRMTPGKVNDFLQNVETALKQLHAKQMENLNNRTPKATTAEKNALQQRQQAEQDELNNQQLKVLKDYRDFRAIPSWMKPLMQGLDDARAFLQKQEIDDLHKQHNANVSTLMKAQEAQLKHYASLGDATSIKKEMHKEMHMDNHNKLHDAMLEQARNGEAIEPPSRAAVSRPAPPVSSLASLTPPRSHAARDNALGALGTDISTTMSADSNSDTEPSISRSSTTTFASLDDDGDDAVSQLGIQLIQQALSILYTPSENLPDHPPKPTWKLEGNEKYTVTILNEEKQSADKTMKSMIEQFTAIGIKVGDKIQMAPVKGKDGYPYANTISIDEKLIADNCKEIIKRFDKIHSSADTPPSPRGP